MNYMNFYKKKNISKYNIYELFKLCDICLAELLSLNHVPLLYIMREGLTKTKAKLIFTVLTLAFPG